MGDKITIGYCRVSTQKNSQQVSLARQEELIRAYCEGHGLAEPVIIAEELSGSSDERPGYRRLLSMCERGEVATVIVQDLSRLSRSASSAIQFMDRQVKGRGIHFVSLQQNLDTSSPGGAMVINLFAVLNSYFLEELRSKTRFALQHKRWVKGEKTGGLVPYGFNLGADGKTLIASKEEMEIIALINRLRASGTTYRGICAELERLGKKTKTGLTHWNPKTIRGILQRGAAASTEDVPVTDPANSIAASSSELKQK